MRHSRILVAFVIVVGLAGTALALRSREGNAQFTSQQESLTRVSPAALQQLILTTSDPRPGHRGRAIQARCVSSSVQTLGNPWSCVVRYPRLPRIRLGVTVHADRSIYGLGRPEGAGNGAAITVRGCCVSAS
jgi:hypothetical protein